uniref:Uncharacterized protein n=1 Tax=Cucumis melo TaxID=3656 RepID=A0A9I9EHZ5_CUCME
MDTVGNEVSSVAIILQYYSSTPPTADLNTARCSQTLIKKDRDDENDPAIAEYLDKLLMKGASKTIYILVFKEDAAPLVFKYFVDRALNPQTDTIFLALNFPDPLYKSGIVICPVLVILLDIFYAGFSTSTISCIYGFDFNSGSILLIQTPKEGTEESLFLSLPLVDVSTFYIHQNFGPPSSQTCEIKLLIFSTFSMHWLPI